MDADQEERVVQALEDNGAVEARARYYAHRDREGGLHVVCRFGGLVASCPTPRMCAVPEAFRNHFVTGVLTAMLNTAFIEAGAEHPEDTEAGVLLALANVIDNPGPGVVVDQVVRLEDLSGETWIEYREIQGVVIGVAT